MKNILFSVILAAAFLGQAQAEPAGGLFEERHWRTNGLQIMVVSAVILGIIGLAGMTIISIRQIEKKAAAPQLAPLKPLRDTTYRQEVTP